MIWNRASRIVLPTLLLIVGCGTSRDTNPGVDDSLATTSTGAQSTTTLSAPQAAREQSQNLEVDVEDGSPEGASSTAPVVSVSEGERCQREGDKIEPLECRRSLNGLRWMSTRILGARADTFADDEVCKLPDQRRLSQEIGLVIGFPRSLSGVLTPSEGVATLAAVAIDFPDFRGAPEELGILSENANNFDAWLANESGGRLSTTWQIHESWITMSKPAADYRVQGFGTEPYQALSTEIVDEVLKVMELNNLDELFIYFPESITNEDQDLEDEFQTILPQIGLPYREYDLTRIRNMKGSGTLSKRNGNVLWAIWSHEFLHSLGLQIHNPAGMNFIDNDANFSLTLSSWSRWILGWLDDTQVACLDGVSKSVEVDLIPLEADPLVPGVRMALIPLTTTTGILIESHRAEGYSANNGFGNGQGIGPDGTYGLLAYFVDSAVTSRDEGQNGPQSSDDPVGTHFLYSDELREGLRASYGTVEPNFKPQPLVQVGETITTDSFVIEFVASSGFDTIRVTPR